MILGKITKSDSQIRYICQINAPHEAEVTPGPADYAFGRFVRVALPPPAQSIHDDVGDSMTGAPVTTLYVVGVICDTVLHNPGFDQVGPRLSTGAQAEVFSPDYVSERIVHAYVLTLGMMELLCAPGESAQAMTRMHGVPLSPMQDGVVETMTDEEIRFFHTPGKSDLPLEVSYLSNLRTEGNNLFPAVALEIIRQLELLMPHGSGHLNILKRSISWRHKVLPMG